MVIFNKNNILLEIYKRISSPKWRSEHIPRFCPFPKNRNDRKQLIFNEFIDVL